MSFIAAIPLGGLVGWNFMTRTLETQQERHAADPVVKREVDHFREKIGKVVTAEDLVADRELLKVALGAFGLGDDLENKHFIKTVLKEGVQDPKSLANRLSDSRYAALSSAFGFGDVSGPKTVLSDFPEKIVAAYQRQSFEVAVGEMNSDFRLALGLERELEQVQKKTSTPNGQWFSVMGSPPLRAVFEGALGLPTSFRTLDIDQQLGVLRKRAFQQFGISEVADFASGENLDRLRQRFLATSDAGSASGVSSAPALSLLGQGQATAGSILSTLYS